jgi:hypothetical protein
MKRTSLGIVLWLALASNAAADTVFGTSVLLYSPYEITTTVCWIYNGGKKPVRITFTGIPPSSPTQPPLEAENDTCLAAPLEPDRSCRFSGGNGVYGGGVARVKGGTKHLRGDCTVFDDTGTAHLTAPMR